MIDLILSEMPFLTCEQAELFERYYALLIEWNARMNLTALTEPEDVVKKHFHDSLLGEPYFERDARVIDVGTGAGFPGVPLALVRPDLKITLLDSLDKRIRFLEAVRESLHLSFTCVHMRAEDAGRSQTYRASFDAAATRAVSALPVLAELTLPLVRVGGISVAYKGAAEQELNDARGALHLLHAHAERVDVPCAWGARSLILMTKDAPTPKAYPRKAGDPAKKPL